MVPIYILRYRRQILVMSLRRFTHSVVHDCAVRRHAASEIHQSGAETSDKVLREMTIRGRHSYGGRCDRSRTVREERSHSEHDVRFGNASPGAERRTDSMRWPNARNVPACLQADDCIHTLQPRHAKRYYVT
jgi:hypothetical protein